MRFLVGLVVAVLVADGVVAIVTADEGPPVIFVHGMSGSLQDLVLEAVEREAPARPS